MNDNNSRKQEIVILVHGFNKDQSDMIHLKKWLERLGYRAITVDLPLTFSAFDQCVSSFQDQISELGACFDYEKIHFVGHSMGGLVIRSFLASNSVPKLGRCVLIATPNQGTKLADISEKVFKPLGQIYKPLKSLTTCSMNIASPMNDPTPQIGVIAGISNKHFLGVLLPKINDGRVEVQSAKCEEMIDFVIRPYGHKDIHHQPEIAELIDVFLQTGKFQASGKRLV